LFVPPALGKSGRTFLPAWSYVLFGWAVMALANLTPKNKLVVVNTAIGLLFIIMGQSIEIKYLQNRVEKLESEVLKNAVSQGQRDIDVP